MIDKLIGRLEERQNDIAGNLSLNVYYSDGYDKGIEYAIEIVNQLAEEYNGGWIPCSERLPEDDSMCLVTVEYPNGNKEVNFGWFDRVGVCWYVGVQELRTTNVLAWMPFPAPFKEGE